LIAINGARLKPDKLGRSPPRRRTGALGDARL